MEGSQQDRQIMQLADLERRSRGWADGVVLPPKSAALLRQEAIDEYLTTRRLPDPARARHTKMLADFVYGFLVTVGLGGVVLAIWFSAYR
jgi:hypothetical protein